VAVGGKGLVILPATPDLERPGAGEDVNGVRVAHAAGPGPGVDVGGPGVGVAGVVGEVGQRPAQLGVDLVAEADGVVFAGGVSKGSCVAAAQPCRSLLPG
jgi:hypothetical protein